MQIELIVIISNLIFLVVGILVGKRTSMPLNSKPMIYKEPTMKAEEDLVVAEMPLTREDIINHDGVGIVQRPSAEELARFAEPQQVKDAKAAVAEEIRNTPEPLI